MKGKVTDSKFSDSQRKEWLDLFSCMNPFEKFLHMERYKIAKRYAEKHQMRKILDLGCGVGYGTSMLGAIGIDKDLEALRIAKIRYPHLDFVRADAVNLPFKDDFELIVSFEVIEHVADARGFLTEIYRCLKNGGLAIISTPNSLLQNLARTIGKQPSWHGHVREYTKASLRKDIQSVGFRVISIRGQLWFPKRFPSKLYFLSSFFGGFLISASYILIAEGSKNITEKTEKKDKQIGRVSVARWQASWLAHVFMLS